MQSFCMSSALLAEATPLGAAVAPTAIRYVSDLMFFNLRRMWTNRRRRNLDVGHLFDLNLVLILFRVLIIFAGLFDPHMLFGRCDQLTLSAASLFDLRQTNLIAVGMRYVQFGLTGTLSRSP